MPKVFISSAEVIAVHGKWPPPDPKIATDHYHLTHPHHSEYDVGGTTTHELKSFGQGHMLYFYFLKYAAIIFGVLAIFPCLPLLVVFLAGPWLGSDSSIYAGLARTTMGNYGLPSMDNSSSDQNSILIERSDIWSPQFLESNGLLSVNNLIDPTSAASEVAISLVFMNDSFYAPTTLGNGWNKESSIIAVAILDLVAVLIFLGAVMWFGAHTKRLALQQDINTVTIHDYSVRVQGLPPDARNAEVQKYFEKWGEVMLVELTKMCDGLMDMVWERKKILAELEEAIAKLQRTADLKDEVNEELEDEVHKLKYDLSVVTAAIKVEQQWQNGETVVDAFITFQDEESQIACLLSNPGGWRQLITGKDKKFREEFSLQITDAPEPSDVKFENLEIRGMERFVRRFLSYILKFLVLLLGFVLVSMAPAIQRNLVDSDPSAGLEACQTTCNYVDDKGALSLSDADRDLYKQCADTGVLDSALSCEDIVICYECFCKAAMGQADITEASYCSGYSSILYYQGAAQALAVLAILLVNLIVPLLIDFLSKFERHHTRSTEARSTARALLVMFFMNTAISIMIANAYLPSLNSLLGSSFISKVLFNGTYPDLTPSWYIQVGIPVLLAQMLSIFTRQGKIFLYWQWRRWKMKKNYKCLTQRGLDHSLSGHEFNLDTRYGEQLSVVFVCLLFASVMPLMYWILAISFTCSYWMEKFELLKVCKKPIMYNADLAVFASAALPYAVLAHLGFACWAFSITAVSQSGIAIGGLATLVTAMMTGMSQAWKHSTVLTGDQVAIRILSADAFPFFIFFFLCLIVVLFYQFVPWHKVKKLFTKEDSLLGGVPEFLVAVRSKLLVGPASYNIRDQPTYQEAFAKMEDYTLTEEELAKLARIEEKEKNSQFGNRKHKKRRDKAKMREALNERHDLPKEGEEPAVFPSEKVTPADVPDFTPAKQTSDYVMPMETSEYADDAPMTPKKSKMSNTKKKKNAAKPSYFDDDSFMPTVNNHHNKKTKGRVNRVVDSQGNGDSGALGEGIVLSGRTRSGVSLSPRSPADWRVRGKVRNEPEIQPSFEEPPKPSVNKLFE